MMQMPKRILVVISGKRKQHEALERALLFAEDNDVHIQLFNSIYEPVMELTDVLSSDHRKEMKRQYMADRYLYMDNIAAELEDKNIKCSIHVTWHRELHEAIEEAAIELKPDLVIKHISAETFSLNPFAMPIDRHLLRYCPAPLLLVRDNSWSKGPILAAVDPMTGDPKHISLNHQIIEYGKMLSHLTENPIHTVNTYEIPTKSASLDAAGIDYNVIKKNTADSLLKKMSSLFVPHDIAAENIHVQEGRAELAISATVKQIGAQLVVLGTVGRTGLAAAFIGNTAEEVLAQLSCEVLVLKPDVSEKQQQQ